MKAIILDWCSIILLISSTELALAEDIVQATISNGLKLIKTPELIMQSEMLNITKSANKGFQKSQYSIQADFKIENTSDHAISREIAFALPPVWCNSRHNSLWGGLDKKSSDDKELINGYKDYALLVNGKKASFTIQSTALLKNKEITASLKKLSLPQNPCLVPVDHNGVPIKKLLTELQKNHLVNEWNEPAWTQKISFSWYQIFPAHQVVTIQHRYTPIQGRTVPVHYSVADLNNWFTRELPPVKPLWSRSPVTLEQSDPVITKTIERYDQPKNTLGYCVAPTWLRYHLTTGAYWSEEIRHFKLGITDLAGAPFAVNQFFKKDTATIAVTGNTLTVTLENFTPQQDLLILFLELPKGADDFHICGIVV